MFEVDQAAGLRQMFALRRPRVSIICGGDAAQVRVSLALAKHCAHEGSQVLMIDATENEIGHSFGLDGHNELAHLIDGEKRLDHVLHRIEEHLLLLPATRGISMLPRLNDEQSSKLARRFAHSGVRPQQLIIHARALSASAACLAFPKGAEVTVVCGVGSAGRTLAYREIKLLNLANRINRFELLVAGASSEASAQSAFSAIAETAERFLNVELNYGGPVALRTQRSRKSGPSIHYSGSMSHVAIA